MLEFLKKRVFPIGIDLGSSYLKMAQLGFDGRNFYLYAAGREEKPQDIELGSADWQKWAVVTAKKMINKGGFSGKQVMAAIPPGDLFIDQMKIPKSTGEKVEQAVLGKVKPKLPFEPKGAMVKYVIADETRNNGEMDVLVMAAERETINRHLAIYEKVRLEIRGMSVWPLAVTNSYVKFFGRRAEDIETVAMLVDIGAEHSNIVVCRHKNLLFARAISIGFKHLGDKKTGQKLMEEMDACSRYLESVSGRTHVQRLVFISGRSVDRNICEKVVEFAEQMQIPAQIGDVLAAVEVRRGCRFDIERRGQQIDWATAFGLSLAGM